MEDIKAYTGPELYSEEEAAAVEAHIAEHFGKYELVMHELYSPDIHVDICLIPPRPQQGHDYYTLVTLGMGAHRMAVPEHLAGQELERAELLINLPSEWLLEDEFLQEEKWYWPLRLLKSTARLPGEQGSWLGWGHSIGSGDGQGYAESTGLCSCCLLDPGVFGGEAYACRLPSGEKVNFYQLIPLYQEELDYKLEHDMHELIEKFPDELLEVIEPERPNAVTDEQAILYERELYDDAALHLAAIRAKKLPVEELAAYNHLAVYLRWCIEQELMSEEFHEKYGAVCREAAEAADSGAPGPDLRAFLRDELGGRLTEDCFDEAGISFSDWYNSGNRSAPFDYLQDVDAYAESCFSGAAAGERERHQGEDYLFVPFDEDYYQGLAQVISGRFQLWLQEHGDELSAAVMDDAQWHLASIREKKLPVEELAAYNHLAVYLRWCLEHDLLDGGFCQKYGARLAAAQDGVADLRAFVRDELEGVLLHPYFDDGGFSRYYYGDGGAPYFPSDVDNYALAYFGPQRYHSQEFRDEAYLFLPFDEDYYQGLAQIIRRRWDAWRRELELGGEAETRPPRLAAAMREFLDCPCQYFAPMIDDEPVTAALSYAQRLGVREGFTPVLVSVEEGLWEALLENTGAAVPGDPYGFDRAKVEQYRQSCFIRSVPDGGVLLHASGTDGLAWSGEGASPLSGGRRLDAFSGYWDYDTNKTKPLLLAQLPVRRPWEVFIYLPFGSGSGCPGTMELMAAAKYWLESCGAVPAALSRGSLEFLLPQPVPEERALELAQEHCAFCARLARHYASAARLADCLRRSRCWHFCWE